MTGTQILHQGRNGKSFHIVKIAITVDGKVNHSQKGIGIYLLLLAHFAHGLVTKAKTDAETAQALQQIIIVLYQRNHLIIRLIHLLILHSRT